MRIYGEPIRGFIEDRLTLVTTGFVAAVIGGFLIARYAFELGMSVDKLAGRLMLVSAVVFAMAAATILTAHGFENLGGYLPCHLCLQERYAYYFGVPPRRSPFLRRGRGSARRGSFSW